MVSRPRSSTGCGGCRGRRNLPTQNPPGSGELGQAIPAVLCVYQPTGDDVCVVLCLTVVGVVRRVFPVVWSGWQGDVPPGADRLTARFPIIPGITGMVREEFIAENTGLLGDRNIQELSEERFVGTLVYPVADPDGATLTVRQREGDPRGAPPGPS